MINIILQKSKLRIYIYIFFFFFVKSSKLKVFLCNYNLKETNQLLELLVWELKINGFGLQLYKKKKDEEEEEEKKNSIQKCELAFRKKKLSKLKPFLITCSLFSMTWMSAQLDFYLPISFNLLLLLTKFYCE